MKTLTDFIKNGSKAFRKANPGLVMLPKRTGMNKTEMLFADRLFLMMEAKQIDRFVYEGVTLKWADMRYTPDFVVFPAFPGAPIMMIEVKGGHIYDRDIVRFKGCRAAWPEFGFQMWQYKNKQWKKKF